MHSKALLWPSEQFHYVSVDPPSYTNFNLGEATDGELHNSVQPFQSDPYGCHSSVLQQKRKERNPYLRMPPYELSCPAMKLLFQWCGPELINSENVPWGIL